MQLRDETRINVPSHICFQPAAHFKARFKFTAISNYTRSIRILNRSDFESLLDANLNKPQIKGLVNDKRG